MGNFLRIFRRRRPPSEELDELVLQINDLELQLKQILDSRAWFLKWLFYTILFMMGAGNAYFWFQHHHIRRKLLFISATTAFGCSAYLLLRFIMRSTYDWLVERKQRRIRFFTDRKVAIIEEVKETEKFKVAKEIIEKYGTQSEVSQWLGPSKVMANGHQNPLKAAKLDRSEREDRPPPPPQKAMPKLYEIGESGRVAAANANFRPMRTPVRPYVEESRTPIDRVLDFVMGESINNRYALICSNCRSHNGMALREEFETLAYYCYKCNFFNPSRAEVSKTRFPLARQLMPPPPPNLDFTGHTDESTENEVESERKASTASMNSDASVHDEGTLLEKST